MLQLQANYQASGATQKLDSKRDVMYKTAWLQSMFTRIRKVQQAVTVCS